MHFASRNLRQDITYWAPNSSPTTNDFGHAEHVAPVLIKGRWQDKVQQIRRVSGEEVTSMAEVMVDREVEIGGFLKLGDHTTHNDPDEDAREIQAYATTPDLRNLGNERRAYL